MCPLPKKAKKHAAKQAAGWPLVVYMWAFGLGVLGYTSGRIALDALPHPFHWGSGLVGAGLGIAVGWLWYRYKGDVV